MQVRGSILPPQGRKAEADSPPPPGSQLKRAAITAGCPKIAFDIRAQRKTRRKRRRQSGRDKCCILQPSTCDREGLTRECLERERYRVGAVELMRPADAAVPHHAAPV